MVLTFRRCSYFDEVEVDSIVSGDAIAERAHAANIGLPAKHCTATVLLRGLSRRERFQAPMQSAVHASSLIMGRLLWQHPHCIRGRNVLGLGSGRGVAELVAAKCGAKEVVMTDAAEASLQFLKENIALNTETGHCHVQRLVWGAPRPILADTLRVFDLILAADCAYEGPSFAIDLLATVETRLVCGGRALLVSPTSQHRAGMAALMDAIKANKSLHVVYSDVLHTDSELLAEPGRINEEFASDFAADVQTFRILVVEKKKVSGAREKNEPISISTT